MKDLWRTLPNWRHHAAVWCRLCALGCLLCALAYGQSENPARRPIAFADLPSALCPWLETQQFTRENFASQIAALQRQTAARQQAGEFDHLIFFVLQSTRFTARTKVEPALSAYEFVQGLSKEERAKFLADDANFLPPRARMPEAARARLSEFAQVVQRKKATVETDERLAYFQSWVQKQRAPEIALESLLFVEYARVMRFLYRKEFAGRELTPADLAAYVARLYQERGHSTDTQIEANFAVYTALAALRAAEPTTRLNNVLIVGPGLDFAPRTDLLELFGPQSYQPFAVADALLGLGLADADRLRIHCVDINERVITHLQGLRQRTEITLALLSGIADTPTHPLTEDFKSYFKQFGRNLGKETALAVPAPYAAHLKKSLRIDTTRNVRITADRLNIITERYAPSPAYDLVVVTNVFPYFKPAELLLALTNLSAMMAEGGYLLHNELQTVPSTFVTPLGLPLVQARTVLLADSQTTPLFDGVALHRLHRRI